MTISPTNVTQNGYRNTVTISLEALLIYNKFSCIFENIGGMMPLHPHKDITDLSWECPYEQ